MASNITDKREIIKSMVREMLENAPAKNTEAEMPEHFVVNSMREKMNREYDRDESAKVLITEDDLRGLDNGARIRIDANARFTPLARDLIAERNLKLITKQPRQAHLKVKSIAIAADHGGFALKEKLIKQLADLDLRVRDFGTDSRDAVDYPDFAYSVAKAVGDGHVEAGIIIDGAGIGSAIAANKVPGVRAAACYSAALAKNSREHNGANVLTLGSGQNSFDEAVEIIEAFLSTELTEERHKRRVMKIDNIDRQYRK